MAGQRVVAVEVEDWCFLDTFCTELPTFSDVASAGTGRCKGRASQGQSRGFWLSLEVQMFYQLSWGSQESEGFSEGIGSQVLSLMSQMFQRLPSRGTQSAGRRTGLGFRGGIQVADSRNVVAGMWTEVSLCLSFQRGHH